MFQPIDILSPAKINLYLGVYDQRDAAGYHRVDSLMAAIDLYDTVHLEAAAGLSVRCIPSIDAPEKSNAAYRAAEELGKALGREPNVAITIEKRIPYKSGLGGASSDAAAVLQGLSRLWGVSAQDERVVATAQAIGADVAFFLTGTPTLLMGRGDVATQEFSRLPKMPLALVRPEGEGITAAQAYADFDREPVEVSPLQPMVDALLARDTSAIVSALANNLEPVALRLMPELQEVHSWLSSQSGVKGVLVTGSGSCTYAICEDVADAQRIAHAAHTEYGWWGRAASIVETGPVLAE